MAVWPGKLVVFVVVPLDMGERERERERETEGGGGGRMFLCSGKRSNISHNIRRAQKSRVQVSCMLNECL